MRRSVLDATKVLFFMTAMLAAGCEDEEPRGPLFSALDGAMCSSSDACSPQMPDASVDANSSADDNSCTVSHCPGATKFTLGAQRCVLMGDKTVRCSEPIELDQTLLGTESMRAIGVDRVTDIVGGGHHGCALHEDGNVSCWGDNRWHSIVPRGEWAQPSRLAPLRIPEVQDAVAISSREGFYQFDITCALLRDGDVTCWGGYLQAPRMMPAFKNAREVRAASQTSFALVSPDEVRVPRPEGPESFALTQTFAHLSAGWSTFCAWADQRVACKDLIYNTPVRYEVVPFTIMQFVITALEVRVVLDSGGRVHVSPVRSEEWRHVPELDGATFIAVDTSIAPQGSVCALFADGTIRCVDDAARSR